MKASQVPFAIFCYLKEGKGERSCREKVGIGERGEVSAICPSPGQTTILERME